MFFLESLFILLAFALFIPIGFLFVEFLATLFPFQSNCIINQPIRPSATILIPAHNEAKVITQCLNSLLPQLTDKDKVIVIADNCTDNTVDIVKNKGLTVIERQNNEQRGKGYAIDYGLKYLATHPPDIVVILDADCIITPQSLNALILSSYTQQKPIQGTYLMQTTANFSVNDRISALAILVKNFVRSYGLKKLNSPCLLNGSGMAFPWSIISQVSTANCQTVDDMQLTVDFALLGYPPRYCPEAKIMGRLMEYEDAKSQRNRWEHGHLYQIFNQVPCLLIAAIKQQRLELFILALELAIPPLSILVILWFITASLSLNLTIIGLIKYSVWFLLGEGFLLFISIIGSWYEYGRDILPARILLVIPKYIIWKLPIYFDFFYQNKAVWNRTERD
ncbi:glycosyltransferase family 2 protein [Cyanothece sp. BG0011]|uniref:glycosyltransferase family 2 protein n=1 Tax=Cyanothece sp. BG0011 TaxID=2082950 RepID=UPI000D1EB70C|nr:glycosyltransferase family 2 protein [Cyanothece sp. BG0011]